MKNQRSYLFLLAACLSISASRLMPSDNRNHYSNSDYYSSSPQNQNFSNNNSATSTNNSTTDNFEPFSIFSTFLLAVCKTVDANGEYIGSLTIAVAGLGIGVLSTYLYGKKQISKKDQEIERLRSGSVAEFASLKEEHLSLLAQYSSLVDEKKHYKQLYEWHSEEFGDLINQLISMRNESHGEGKCVSKSQFDEVKENLNNVRLLEDYQKDSLSNNVDSNNNNSDNEEQTAVDQINDTDISKLS